jgi:uncharacterized protein (TIGR02284 family)
MAVDHERTLATLNTLIDACHDDEKGFQSAAECVKNHELKTLFRAYSSQRGQYAAELADEVRRLGGQCDAGGTVSAALRRGWINLKAAVTGGDEKAIIVECERGEAEVRESYEAALRENLRAEIVAVIQRQFRGIQEAYDHIQALQVAAARL